MKRSKPRQELLGTVAPRGGLSPFQRELSRRTGGRYLPRGQERQRGAGGLWIATDAPAANRLADPPRANGVRHIGSGVDAILRRLLK